MLTVETNEAKLFVTLYPGAWPTDNVVPTNKLFAIPAPPETVKAPVVEVVDSVT